GLFNGKIDRPKLFDRALDPAEIKRLQHADSPLPPGVVAAWDFSKGMADTTVHDLSPRGLHGVTVNLPTRAVTDHTWTGEELRWTGTPAQYSAIHFHDDDLDDARWQPTFDLLVAESLKSGVYAMRLEAEGGAEEYIPF